jgi:hypothetical protein
VPLVSYVVEIWQVFAESSLVLPLLKDVLAFIPIPSLVNLAEILNNELVRLDAFLALAKYAKAL